MRKLSKFDHWVRAERNFARVEVRYTQGKYSRKVYQFLKARTREVEKQAIEELFGGENK